MSHPYHSMKLVSAVLIADWQQARRLLADAPPQQDELIAWLRRHHLAGQFAAIIADSPLRDAFSDRLLEQAQRQLAWQTGHNARVLATTHRATEQLRDCGIPSMLLKGVHYAVRFHAGLEQRFLWDVDLLVHAADREAAVRCLLGHRYQTQTDALWNNRVTRGLAHAVSLIEEPNQHHDLGIEVDLHWHLRNRPAYRIDYAALWDSRQAFCIADDCFDVPADEYCLLTLLLGIVHDLEAGRFKLKQFFDLHRMLHVVAPDMNWERFFERREAEHLERLAANALALYLLLFDVGIGTGTAQPDLVTALERRRAMISVNNIAGARRLVEGARQNLHNRRWYASLYPGGRLRYALWWSTTAPIRYAIGRTV